MHFDHTSGAYSDYGDHTEKVLASDILAFMFSDIHCRSLLHTACGHLSLSMLQVFKAL